MGEETDTNAHDEYAIEMLEGLGKEFPGHAIKRRQGGGNRFFDYVETHSVINRLNAVAKNWDWSIDRMEFMGDLIVVVGTLTIPALGSRSGTGVQKTSSGGGEDLVKGAASDALKKAATLFGVALHLYGPDYEEAAQPKAPPTNQPKPVDTPPVADMHPLVAKKREFAAVVSTFIGGATPTRDDLVVLFNLALGKDPKDALPTEVSDWEDAIEGVDLFLSPYRFIAGKVKRGEITAQVGKEAATTVGIPGQLWQKLFQATPKDAGLAQ